MIITKVTERTDLCAPIATALKKNGDVPLCVDLTKLTYAVKRKHYMLPYLDDIAPQLRKATIFSQLDASSGFIRYRHRWSSRYNGRHYCVRAIHRGT